MQLFIVVGILLAIDFAIMTTWQLVDPFYRDTKNMTKYVRRNTARGVYMQRKCETVIRFIRLTQIMTMWKSFLKSNSASQTT